MKYVRMGTTGTEVSRLCLGAMSFGAMADWMIDEAASLEIMRSATESGINFFDTADIYSRGETAAQVAIAWMLTKPGVTAPILGATKVSHLEDPIKAVESPLSAEEVAMLEAPYEAQAVIGALGKDAAAARDVRASSMPRGE